MVAFLADNITKNTWQPNVEGKKLKHTGVLKKCIGNVDSMIMKNVIIHWTKAVRNIRIIKL
jgi:hypothetical protein